VTGGADASRGTNHAAPRADAAQAPIGRLAPTPSGRLHLGNVVAFGAAWLHARAAGGSVLLRIEDVDIGRARADLADGLREDLRWLGLTWDREVQPQRDRAYDDVLERVRPHLYACTCTRTQWRGSYPGICRDLARPSGALRLRLPAGSVSFVDLARGPQAFDPNALGDPVLRRRDGVYTYTLAVVADDLRDGVTEVVRGSDLLDATTQQIRLYEALNAPPPLWLHTPMLVDVNGRKLGKSHGSRSIQAMRAAGWTPEAIWRLALPWLGIAQGHHLHDAVRVFRAEALPPGPIPVTIPEEAPP
jgi:glutamyl/glutaminyl-tRNA synthetase